ncbi:hypothetical protein DXB27_14705 [Parabacteroides gordonii]|nr:hypothetical protein DXB27_14705 [Parabacteroides gordonii]
MFKFIPYILFLLSFLFQISTYISTKQIPNQKQVILSYLYKYKRKKLCRSVGINDILCTFGIKTTGKQKKFAQKQDYSDIITIRTDSSIFA